MKIIYHLIWILKTKDLFSLEAVTTTITITTETGVTRDGQKVVGIGVARKELLVKDIGGELTE